MITYRLFFRNINGEPCQQELYRVFDDPDDEATLQTYDTAAKLHYREWRKKSFHCTDMKLVRTLPVGFENSPWHNVIVAANEA